MVGPFMQGILLMGIIYWYSKSMMSMINDYYRSEFQRKLQAVAEPKPTQETTLNVDNFMDYVRDMEAKEHSEQQTAPSVKESSIEPTRTVSPQLMYFLYIAGAYTPTMQCSAAEGSVS